MPLSHCTRAQHTVVYLTRDYKLNELLVVSKKPLRQDSFIGIRVGTTVQMDVCSSGRRRQVLILGPRNQDRAAVDKIKESMKEYNFHFLDPDVPMVYPSTLPSSAFSSTLDILGFVKKAAEYVHQNDIVGVLFSYDNMAMVAAAVCQETGLPGPSFESEFLCLHKYYSRLVEPSKLWCKCTSLQRQPQQLEMEGIRDCFPCFLKPATLTGSVGVCKVSSFSELKEKLTFYCNHLPSLTKAFQPLFHHYLDLEKYPLATTATAVVEEYVEDEGRYHCFEGWADSKGEVHHWATYDSLAVDVGNECLVGFFIPTMEQANAVDAIVSHTRVVVKNHGLKSVFFNVDLWKRGDRIDIIEINGRCTPSTMGIYHKLYGSSVYKVMTYLACEEDEKCHEESPQMKPIPSLLSGRFRWYTNRNGIASDILKFPLARTIGEKEEIYDVTGEKSAGITLYVEEDEYILSGTQVGNFVIFGISHAQLWERAKGLVSLLCNN